MFRLKKAAAFLLCTVIIFSFSGCKIQKTDGSFDPAVLNGSVPADIHVYGERNSGGFVLAALKKDYSDFYDVNFVKNLNEIENAVEHGEADIAVVPLGTAASLYNKTGGAVEVIAVNSVGAMYVFSQKNDVTDVPSLRNEPIHTSGENTDLQWMFRFVLEENEVELTENESAVSGVPEKTTEEETTTSYYSYYYTVPQKKPAERIYLDSYADVAAAAMNGTADTVVLPEPYASKVNSASGFKLVADLGEEFNKLTNSQLVSSCIIARRDFVNNTPEGVEQFLSDFGKATMQFNSSNGDEGAAVLVEQGFFTDISVASAAVPGCGATFIRGEEMKKVIVSNLNILESQSPDCLGGKLPSDGFCYVTK